MREEAVIIIATRPESKRLPNKAFLEVAGIPAIEHIIQRVLPSEYQIILAVPHLCHDYDYLKSDRIHIYHGDPDSPLHRMKAAYVNKKCFQDYIIRITHDDILIDLGTMMRLVQEAIRQDAGYAISPSIVEGAGVEVIRKDNLFWAAEHHKDPTEFVSYFVKHHPRNNVVHMEPRKSVAREYRLTMDYYGDWLVLDMILRHLGPFAELEKIVSFIDFHPYIMNWNRLPDISAYTCAYNAEPWIEKTIQSVISQNHPNFEYIIIDDASTDQTDLVVSKYSNFKNLKFIRNNKNKGLASCSNQAVSEAKGKYLIRVDADDRLMTNALQKMLLALEGSHTGILYSGYNMINVDDVIIAPNISPEIHHHAGCAMMDKKLINEIRFTDGLKHWDSLDLFRRIKTKCEIAYHHEPLWYYRKRDDSLSAKMTEDRRKTLEDIENE